MNNDTVTLGGLRCRMAGGVRTSTLPLGVVLCHGYGAPGDDLVSLAPEVFHTLPALEQKLCFVFPEAPLVLTTLGPWDSRAWWPLDESILDAAITRGTPLEVPREIPAELPTLRRSMERLLADLERTIGIPTSRVVLGGFSQGAMLATDVTLHLPSSPAGLCVFSGTLLDDAEWERLAPGRRGLSVLMSHGRQDPLLSYRVAERMRDLLLGGGLTVEFVPFDGPHTIAPEGFRAFVAMLGRLAGS